MYRKLHKQEKIRIAGAGLSGLSAAITLARGGKEVEVIEKNKSVGGQFKDSVHAFRNYPTPLQTILDEIGLQIGHLNPIYKTYKYSPSLKSVEIDSDIPVHYTVLRGSQDKKTIDNQLYKQAKKEGVKFRFNTTAKPEDVDIIATGHSHTDAVGYGATYTNANIGQHDCYLLYNEYYSPGGYIYVLPHGKETEVVTTCFKHRHFEDVKGMYEALINQNPVIRKILDGAKYKTEVSGKLTYDIRMSLSKSTNNLFVGEAAGFMDAARGFGMTCALESGHLAARSIISNMPYEELWRAHLQKEMIFNFKRRILYQLWNNEHIDHDFDKYRRKKITLMEYVHERQTHQTLKKDILLRIIYPLALLHKKTIDHW